ncbi:DnaB-like helicase C-terminal domain-containing protein [Myxococcota bacterium]
MVTSSTTKADLDQEFIRDGLPPLSDTEPYTCDDEPPAATAEDKLSEVSEQSTVTEAQLGAQRVDQQWGEFSKKVDARAAGSIPAVPTGLETLDERLGGGIQASQVALLCGSPGTGKSSLALSWGLQHAESGGRTIFWSIELPLVLVLARLVSLHTGAPWIKVLRGECPRETEATGDHIAGLDLFVVDQPGQVGADLVSALLPCQSPGSRPSLLVVDYLQLLASAGGDQRVAVEEASAWITETAKMTGAAVLAISSTSRAAYNLGHGGKPDLAKVLVMARDSGRLEFDAGVVLGLCAVGDDEDEGEPERYSKAWLVVAKNRLGLRGKVAIELDGQAGTACEIAPEDMVSTGATGEAIAAEVLTVVSAAQLRGKPLTSKNEIAGAVFSK